MINKTTLIFNTVRYLTPRQWKYRLYYKARSVRKRKPRINTGKNSAFPFHTLYASDIKNTNAIKTANKILENEIPTISGRVIKFTGDWDLASEEYRIVSFKLNSFRWLLDLSDAYKVTGEKKYIEKGFELIRDWQSKNKALIKGDKWNPYVIAERITNWVSFCSEYCGQTELDEFAAYIYPQAYELKSSVEYHLGANHLLSEAKALVFAGAFLDNDSLYNSGKKLLIDEAKEQFYPDGGHYEQSLSYHVESLQQYFEAFVVLTHREDKDIAIFSEIMREPYRFLNSMIGANGKIPLFNDAAYDYPFYDAADFLATAEYIFSMPPNGLAGNYAKRWKWVGKGTKHIDWSSKVRYKNSGFIHYPFRINGKRFSFFMDCGNNGPEYNLGHAHADSLSILLCSEEKDILIDSGVFTYQPGAERNECRSTKAHNTVEIDDSNSAEVWSAFRVAKRGHTKIIDFSVEDGFKIKASHDGYKVCLGTDVIHMREVIIKKGIIEINDKVEGNTKHKAVSRFHVSPECSVKVLEKKSCCIDNIIVQSDKEIRITDCKVARMFGIKEITKCLEIDFTNSLKIKFKLT